MEDVETKAQDIYRARTYIYKSGEAEMISNKKFERALKEGTLGQFPNVTFFQKKKENEMMILKQMPIKSEYDRQIIETQITKLEQDMAAINSFLNQDLRISKFRNSEGVHQQTIENIEEQEDKKMYYEWAERQTQASNGVSKQDMACEQAKINANESLFKEIQSIIA